MKIKCKVDGKYYALKRYRENFLSPETILSVKEEIFREIDHLRKLKHPNIIKIEDLIKENDRPALIMELCDGSLQDFIELNIGKIIHEQ